MAYSLKRKGGKVIVSEMGWQGGSVSFGMYLIIEFLMLIRDRKER